ncbi:unnamed protein product [Lampetra planeri]
MSKHLKKKNQPTPSSDDDDNLPRDMAVSGAEGTDEMVTGDSAGVQDVIDGAGPFSSSGIEEGWRRVAEQIDSLRSVLLKLVTLVATGPEQPRIGPRDGESSGGPEPSAIVASARLPAIADMWQGAAILGAAATELGEAAILSPPRGAAASDY